MSIWVRSQDKMILRKVTYLDIEKVYLDESTGQIHDYDYVNNYVEIDDEREQQLKLVYYIEGLGMYSTLEKALKVLNDIQITIATKSSFKSMDNEHLSYCINELEKRMSDDEILQQMFGAYQMPQDEEVK